MTEYWIGNSSTGTASSDKVQWALSLQPGDKVLTNWDDKYPSDDSMLLEDLVDWNEVTVAAVKPSEECQSGVVVSLAEYPKEDDWFDIAWIKPLEQA